MADGGQTSSKEEPGHEVGRSDDKLIGNRKVRTILLCSALVGFCIFAMGYVDLVRKNAATLKDSGCIGDVLADCTEVDGLVHGSRMILAGLIFTMLLSVIIAVMVCIPQCDPSKFMAARIPGFFLLVLGSGVYLFGWFYYVSKHKSIYHRFLPSDQAQSDQNAAYLQWIAEACIFGGTAALLSIDLLFPTQLLMEDEFKRIFLNLTLLGTCSIFTMVGYFGISGDGSTAYGPTLLEFGRTGAATIGSGYVVIFLASVTYLIVFFCSCCKGNKCRDHCAFRAVLAIMLVVGGIVTAIGYWVYSGEGLGEKGNAAKGVAYYVGYSGFIGALCVIWGLDIAWDDIKND